MPSELRTIERTVRVVCGAIFIYASHLVMGAGSLVMSALGLYAIVTGFLGSCFICNFM